MDTSLPIIALKQLAGNEPTHLYPVQEMMLPYVDFIAHAWIALWILTALVLTAQLAREYRSFRERV